MGENLPDVTSRRGDSLRQFVKKSKGPEIAQQSQNLVSARIIGGNNKGLSGQYWHQNILRHNDKNEQKPRCLVTAEAYSPP